ncbi:MULTISPECIES: hypothetical protein [unclassified Vibrio]|uniref:hypothetical protein n=1 Tax=unclassified Vibrio TaxID=2614977 RepID=UPI00159E8E70|nr:MULTISPECIES: hypothetical protein [unclassified Vibrio]NVN83219.1 hypothetical protein [Vibrio sp. Scap16]QLE91628.1 hypothetical protein FLM53_00415 [Vibrio sp. Scap24]
MNNSKHQLFNMTTLVIFDHIKHEDPFDTSLDVRSINETVSSFFDSSKKPENHFYVVDVVLRLTELNFIQYKHINDDGVIGACFTAYGREQLSIEIASLQCDQNIEEPRFFGFGIDIAKLVVAGLIEKSL